ncbi:MFS transporter [Hwanghaeella grinnelliae]|uniref:MFS transporter n=2 Tax=Hwanghaeella grinnelliae TaxID=2500179 RepID=A0A437QLC9_9PROT|nr:MFS transporter [Hwanghaeella grinnelliae]
MSACRYDPTLDGAYAWFRVGVSLTMAAIGSVGLWSYVVILPLIEEEFSVGRGDASFPYTMTMLGFAFGNMAVGRMVDRYGVSRPALVAIVGLCLGYLGVSQTDNFYVLNLYQGLFIGISTAAGFGPLIADISKWFRKRRGLAMAAVASGNYLAGAIWPPIIQYVVEAEGWRFAYAGIGVFCLVAMTPLALMLRSAPPNEAQQRAANGGVAHEEHVQAIGLSPRALQILLVIAGLGCCVAMSMPQVHIVAYCVDLGYEAARGAEMLSLMLAAGVICRLSSGWLADKIGGVRTLLLGSVLQCVALFLYLPFDGLASLYVVSLLFGLAQGGIVPCYAVIVREYLPVSYAGRAIGVIIMSTVLGMALGGWLSGAVYEVTGSYTAAFLNGIGWNLVNILVMVLILLRSGRARTAPA